MKNCLKNLTLGITSLLALLVISSAPALAYIPGDPNPAPTPSPSGTPTPSPNPAASGTNCNATTTKEALQCGAGVGNNSNPTKSINHTFANVINIFSVVAGILAVIMIVLAGTRYITSGGSQEKVASAKSTLTYAIIGLIIVALAQVLVQFVLNKTVNP